MEKIIELLNQFEKEKKSGYTRKNIDSYDNCVYGVDSDGETEITMYSDLYSKQYGFIKWLVDNDKIVLGDIALKVYNLDLGVGRHTYKEYLIYESLLMLLSIQDNQIDFLISILK